MRLYIVLFVQLHTDHFLGSWCLSKENPGPTKQAINLLCSQVPETSQRFCFLFQISEIHYLSSISLPLSQNEEILFLTELKGLWKGSGFKSLNIWKSKSETYYKTFLCFELLHSFSQISDHRTDHLLKGDRNGKREKKW